MIYDINMKYKNITRGNYIIPMYMFHYVKIIIKAIKVLQKNIMFNNEFTLTGRLPDDKSIKFILVHQDHLTKFILLRPRTR